jgi:hypothetical protein
MFQFQTRFLPVIDAAGINIYTGENVAVPVSVPENP